MNRQRRAYQSAVPAADSDDQKQRSHEQGVLAQQGERPQQGPEADPERPAVLLSGADAEEEQQADAGDGERFLLNLDVLEYEVPVARQLRWKPVSG